ncbi:MAG: hypothetical protein M3Q52_10590 [Pseudomonadota bacterium]|nr:hypothetical protein [Pseudomonadota bacterium]
MIHFAPELPQKAGPAPYAEAVARLASLKHALRLVDPVAPIADAAIEERVASAWGNASDASRRCFAARSERSIGAAAAGLEAVLAERRAGREPNTKSVERLADEIRTGLQELQRVLRA